MHFAINLTFYFSSEFGVEIHILHLDLDLLPGVIKPARSAGFSRIKKIPYQAPPTQLGPRKCTF